MIPVRLRLHNFLCYRDVEPLDFTGIHLACLSGENGHGKSAILDAITWALWGRARASTDDLIHYNEIEMEVEFEFLLGDETYRVIRKRDRRQRGQSQLELQVAQDGVFHPITETTLRKTQARINEILRMDYDTFINSSFLLQGRADEFTTKTPMQRKDILADILGLSIYDEYEARAKEQAKEREAQAKLMAVQLADWERELEQQPVYEQELAQAEETVAEANEQLSELDGRVQALRREHQDLEAKRVQAEELSTRISRLQGEAQNLRQRIQIGQDNLAGYERVLAERDRIERGYRELMAVRKHHDELNQQLQEVMRLNQRRTELQGQLDAKRHELLTERRHLESRAAEFGQKAARRAHWDEELQKIAIPLNNLSELEERLPGLREEVRLEGEEIVRLEAQLARLQDEIREVAEKSTLLSAAEAQCPLCGSDLTDDHRQRLLHEMQIETERKEQTVATIQKRIAEVSVNVNTHRSDVRKYENQLGNLPNLHQRKAKLETAREEAEQAAAEAVVLQGRIDELAAQTESVEWAADIRSQLDAVSNALATIGYDEAAHEKNRSALQELSSFEDERTRLFAAEENLRQERAHLDELLQLTEGRQRELAAAQEEEQTLLAHLPRLAICLTELQVAEAELVQMQKKEAHARQVLGAARQKLEACHNLAEMRKAKIAERKTVLYEQGIYDDLCLAFGKRGIQAMIIESSIPEIEEEANAILFRMTDGRMRIQLDTQRETKARDVVETLDIIVSDELGPRPYELYSGGEAFRINFALRVALSKLLARRAGASLRTLVIDEGFGTQDTQGRERLVESINAIQEDFDKVLVITHIDELKDAFPVCIEVFKTPSGSQIRVT